MPRPPLSPRRFFIVWLQIGAQSFGGGTASLALIRRASVDTYGWQTEAEFVRDWAIVQLTPGINLLALIVLIGQRWGGAAGITLALGGLLLPSALVTVAMAALYTLFADVPLVQSALRGILPATVGLGMLTAFQIVRPLMRQSSKESAGTVSVSILIIVGSAMIAAAGRHLAVLLILCGAGALLALFRALSPVTNEPTELLPNDQETV